MVRQFGWWPCLQCAATGTTTSQSACSARRLACARARTHSAGRIPTTSSSASRRSTTPRNSENASAVTSSTPRTGPSGRAPGESPCERSRHAQNTLYRVQCCMSDELTKRHLALAIHHLKKGERLVQGKRKPAHAWIGGAALERTVVGCCVVDGEANCGRLRLRAN